MRGNCETAEATCNADASGVAASSARQPHARRWRPIPTTAVLGVIVVTGYAAFERFGTTANVDSVEHTQNLAGGFLPWA